MYVVHDAIWKQYGVGRGKLCATCLGKRMGRSVSLGDLKVSGNTDVMLLGIAIWEQATLAERQVFLGRMGLARRLVPLVERS
jgi:hypothetical protein